jgi:CRP-like cAMP-binding protein
VETITQASLARLPRARFLEWMRSEPDFALAVAALITKRARAMSQQLYEMATLKLNDRLRLELRRLAIAQGIVSGEAIIQPAPTHQALAARLAANRESISRELSRLVQSGVIECGRKRILIKDLARLTAPDGRPKSRAF